MKRAFTLIELMVVISIIALLSVLAFPAFKTARKASDNATCVSNLRQIGLAIQNYCNDNDGNLPGPTYQGLSYSFTYPNLILTSYLSPYLTGSTPVKGQTVQVPSVLCPAYKRQVSASQWNFSYYAVYRIWSRSNAIVTSSGNIMTPWGHSGSGVNNLPMNWTSLNANTDPAAQWAIRDADCTSYGNYVGLPAMPVHGNYWNQLYFDWHVEALRTSDRRSPND